MSEGKRKLTPETIAKLASFGLSLNYDAVITVDADSKWMTRMR